MKKVFIPFYVLLVCSIISIVVSCYDIAFSPYITSAPWTLGLVYPACYFTLPLFFYSIFLEVKYKYHREFILAAGIIIFQIVLLFM